MNRIARRGLAVAALGTLALALTACGAIQEAAEDAEKEASSTALTCTDLGEQVDKYSPDINKAISESEPADFDALAQWMVDNGPKFEDAELGAAVVTWGELGAMYFNEADAPADSTAEPMSGKDFDAFEAASATIDDASNCKDMGFGLQ